MKLNSHYQTSKKMKNKGNKTTKNKKQNAAKKKEHKNKNQPKYDKRPDSIQTK